MTTDLETLRQLRDASDPSDHDECNEQGMLFACAAHAALGPDGCLTRELERLQDELETQTVGHRGAVEGWNEMRAERDALKDEVKRLRESVLQLADQHSRYPDRPLTSADELAVALHKLLDK